MRRFILVAVLSLCLFSCTCCGQSPTLQQKLYYTCKVWGFVKYYHSNVSACNVNWDSVLVSVLPTIESASNDSEFNDALDTMLAAAGPMAIATTYFPDTLPVALKRNRDWSWIASPALRSDVQVQLDTIKNNFRPHDECWVENNTYTTSYQGWLVLPYDNPELDANTFSFYPDRDHRLLMFFKYWNVVRYFYPYNYALDIPWDTTLYNYSVQIDSVIDTLFLYQLYLKIVTTLDDAHVCVLTYSNYFQTLPGSFLPCIRLKYIEGQYVVINSLVSGINIGDAIISVDGLTTTQWEDSLKPYYSSGNMSVFRRNMCENMLGRQTDGGNETLVVEDGSGIDHTIAASCVDPYSYRSFFYKSIYPADSLNTIEWTAMPCNIGYVNMGNLQDSNVNAMYRDFQSKTAIIFDLRNYPNGTAWDIANLIYPYQMEFASDMTPDVTYPGTYYWYYDSLGINGNPTRYTGKVIILMNEETQSQAEYSCMILGVMPGAIKLGSQTAGADGNVSYWNLSQDIHTGFTTLGVFYPNGDSTQRIGIVPDSVVYPTRAGIRNGDDEVLDKALQIACSASSVQKVTNSKASVRAYPNPACEIINIDANNFNPGRIAIELSDITGRILLQKEIENSSGNITTSMDIKGLVMGMYFLILEADGRQYVRKIVKE